MQEYGRLLKELMNFSGMKMSTVADILSYDISYISKWCSGSKLPGSKTAAETNRCLSAAFSAEIRSLGDTKRFAERFGKETDDAGLDRCILTMLNSAYRRSSSSTDVPAPAASVRAMQLLTTRDELHSFFSVDLPEFLSGCGDSAELLVTLDICALLDFGIHDFPQSIGSSTSISVKLALDSERFYSDSHEHLKKLYSFLNIYNTVSFDIYDASLLSAMNAIIVKDRLAVICSLDEKRQIRAAAISYDTEKISHLQLTVQELFRCSEPIIHADADAELEQNGYRMGFYSRDCYHILSAKGFEYLLPAECWQFILGAAKEKNDGGLAARMTVSLQIAWEENFEKAALKFYIPKSSLMRYIEDGEIIFFDFAFRMSSAQRKQQINNILDITKKNPGILFCIIDDSKLPELYSNFGITIYNNSGEVFAKNLWHIYTGQGAKAYHVDSKRMIQEINRFFDTLGENPLCTVYDADALQRFVDRYGTMINRMLDSNDI